MALNPLPNGQAIVTPDGQPTIAFSVYWQQVIGDIDAQLAAITKAQADIIIAQNTANNTLRDLARIASYTAPSSVLSAVDAGTSATINVAAHTRIYPGVLDIAHTAKTITGLAFSTTYWVYYDDITLANANPTFLATTNSEQAQIGGSDGRHFVGKVTTPADGAAATTGTGNTPPGGGGGEILP